VVNTQANLDRTYRVAHALSLRVAALTESPEAFGSTVVRERGLPLAKWQARLTGNAWFAAFDAEIAVGLACGVHTETPGHGLREDDKRDEPRLRRSHDPPCALNAGRLRGVDFPRKVTSRRSLLKGWV